MKAGLDLDKRVLACFMIAVAILGSVFLFVPAKVSAATSGTYFDHVVVIAFENQPYDSIIGSGSDPFITSLLPNAAVFDMNSYPSSPSISGCSAGCYTAFTSGNSYGVSDGVSSGSVSQTNLFDRLTGAGLSWVGYCENGCPRSGDHFPCLQYSDTYQSSNCVTLSGPLVGNSQVLSTFNSANPPNYIWLTPDDTDNMHNTSVGTGDSWLLSFLVGSGSLTNPASGSLLSTSLFTNPNSRTLLLLWWDECSSSCSSGPFSNNDKAEIYYGPMVNRGHVDTTTQYTDYNALRTIEDNWGLACLSNGCSPTTSITDLFSGTSSLSDSFTFNPLTPTTGTAVTFTGSAQGGTSPYVYSWSFGDGSSGSGANVSHTYTSAGKYTATLNVTDSSSKTATTSQTITVNSPSPPSVSFTYSPSSPFTGSVVSFTATGTGGKSPYAFNWKFGDGGTATGAGPTHSYSAAGTYSVNVTVTDANSLTGTSSQQVIVSVPPPPDFSIAASPSTLTIQASQAGTSTITLSSINGFSANVSLMAGVSPMGPSAGLSASGVDLSSGGSAYPTLTVSTSNSTAAGVYYVTVNASATSGSLFHQVQLTITVSAAPSPDFTYSPSPKSLTLEPGQTGTSTITFSSVNSFSGTISLTPTGSNGLSLSLGGPSLTLSSGGSGSVVLTVGVLSSVGPGSYSANVTASGASVQHVITVTIRVVLNNPPSVSVPGSQSVTPGSQVIFVVNASDSDTNETVVLSVSGLPPSASFDQSTGRFSWTPGASDVGSYNVTFTGTDNGSPAKSTSKSVTINVHSAAVQPPPTTQPKNQGGVCLQCMFTKSPLALVWLVAVGAATGAILGIGVLYLRARSGVRNARRMRRLTRRY